MRRSSGCSFAAQAEACSQARGYTCRWYLTLHRPRPLCRYRLYLDGELVNQLQEGQVYYTNDGYPVQVRPPAVSLLSL